jgi:hypothetical protein
VAGKAVSRAPQRMLAVAEAAALIRNFFLRHLCWALLRLSRLARAALGGPQVAVAAATVERRPLSILPHTAQVVAEARQAVQAVAAVVY